MPGEAELRKNGEGADSGPDAKFTPAVELDVIDATAEKSHSKPVTTIDIRRHSQYEGGFPKAGWGKATEGEQELLGHLTETGVENARKVARELVAKRINEADGNVDFLVVASPTHWLGDEKLGQRAIETANIYAEEIKRQLEEAGVAKDQLEKRIVNLKQSRRFENDQIRPDDRLVEAQIFDDPRSLKLIDRLREEYGGQGTEFWDAWYSGKHDQEHKEVGGETSLEAADRVNDQIDSLIRYGRLRTGVTGRSLAVFVLTHHEALQPIALHSLGVPTSEFTPDKNEGFEIKVDSEGVATATIGDRQIPIKSNPSGKPEPTERG